MDNDNIRLLGLLGGLQGLTQVQSLEEEQHVVSTQ